MTLDQGINIGTKLGVLEAFLKNPVTKSSWYGVSADQWWLQDTLETTLTVKQTKQSKMRLAIMIEAQRG